MKQILSGMVFFCILLCCVSCTEYTPKPRGYFRIEPPQAGVASGQFALLIQCISVGYCRAAGDWKS